jgi:hypothetical protein
MEFFTWLENSGFAAWVRGEAGALWVYDVFLVSHALGMAAVVGLSAAIALRVLGCAPSLPLAPMESLFPFAYAGFWINATSGLALFAAYPTGAAANPGFYIKMAAVVTAVVTLNRLRQAVFDQRIAHESPLPLRARKMAGVLLFSWWVALLSGRLLAYHGITDVERTSVIAVTLVSALMLLTFFVVRGRQRAKAAAAHLPETVS